MTEVAAIIGENTHVFVRGWRFLFERNISDLELLARPQIVNFARDLFLRVGVSTPITNANLQFIRMQRLLNLKPYCPNFCY